VSRNGLATGTVKWFSSEKGFGFVRQDAGGDDCFVHYSHINAPGYRQLEPGQRVQYEPVETERGLQARDVSILNDETRMNTNRGLVDA
jgi:CspA family cold shock protein